MSLRSRLSSFFSRIERASCCVIVLPPCRSPREKCQAARSVAGWSIAPCEKKRSSSLATTASFRTCGNSPALSRVGQIMCSTSTPSRFECPNWQEDRIVSSKRPLGRSHRSLWAITFTSVKMMAMHKAGSTMTLMETRRARLHRAVFPPAGSVCCGHHRRKKATTNPIAGERPPLEPNAAATAANPHSWA